MNKLSILFALSSFLFLGSCNENEFNGENIEKKHSACGVTDPGNKLPWLKAIIKKAEDDRINKTYMGNYMGKIYLGNYKGQDIFFVDMAMGSGGLAGYDFRCDGTKEDFNNNSDEMLNFRRGLKKARIVYSNLNF